MRRTSHLSLQETQPDQGPRHIRELIKLRFGPEYILHSAVYSERAKLHGMPFLNEHRRLIIATSNKDIAQFRRRGFKPVSHGWIQVRLLENDEIQLYSTADFGLTPYSHGLWNPTNYVESALD